MTVAGEPTYDLDTGEWSHRCPCISAQQRDPECPWHGRPQEAPDPDQLDLFGQLFGLDDPNVSMRSHEELIEDGFGEVVA